MRLRIKRSLLTGTEIISIHKEADAGMKVRDLCYNHGISHATYYNLKSKHVGMDVSELKHMKEIEGELSQCRRM